MRISTFLVVTAIVFYVSSAWPRPMEVKLESPKFTILIPDLEAFALDPHPNAATQPTARLLGSAPNGTTLSVLTPTTSPDTTPAQCASWLAGTVVSRYAPDLDTLQLVKAGNNAYILLFPFKVGGLEQLKAFVVSGNGKGQCLEVHISRIGASAPERQLWLNGFRSVRVQSD